MFTKTVSVITLIAFVMFTLSCGTTRYGHINTAPEWEGKRIRILRVQKVNGETIKDSVLLKDFDTVELGSYKFQFYRKEVKG